MTKQVPTMENSNHRNNKKKGDHHSKKTQKKHQNNNSSNFTPSDEEKEGTSELKNESKLSSKKKNKKNQSDSSKSQAVSHNNQQQNNSLRNSNHSPNGGKAKRFNQETKETLLWSLVKTTGKGPGKRGFHSCTAVGQKLYIIGGDNRESFFNDIYEFDTSTKKWYQLPKSSYLKFPRTGHTCTYYNNKLFVFGGKQQTKYLADLLVFDLDTRKWSTIKSSSSFRIKPRGAHTATMVNGKLYIFGGLTGHDDDLEYLSTLLVFDLETYTWSIPRTKGTPPSERAGHTSIAINNDIYIFGGRKGTIILNDLFVLNTEKMSWKKIKAIGKIPETRAGHSMVAVSNNNNNETSYKYILVWGGSDWNTFFPDVYIFCIDSQEWRICTCNGELPDARFWHTSSVVGSKMYLFGGGEGKGLYNDMHILDLSSISTNLSSTFLLPQSSTQIPTTSNNSTTTISTINNNNNNNNTTTTTTTTIATNPSKENVGPNNNNLTTNALTPSGPPKLKIDIDKKNKDSITEEQLQVKVVFKSENRVKRIHPNCTFLELAKKLSTDFGEDVKLKYMDDEKDKITIRSDDELKECFLFFKSRNRTIKLELEAEEGSALTPVGTPRAGKTIATINPSTSTFRWKRGNLLGEGTYGKVYLGMIESGEFIAVKQVRITAGAIKESTIKDLLNEINVMNILQHENIVRYLGAERTNNLLNIFLEYVPGGSIQQILRQFKTLDESVVRRYTRQILFGLKFLHDNKIIHRDIKGANILVDDKGTVKLADFGHSKILTNETSKSSQVRGTPIFMAPEVIKARKHEKASDIWSLGCTIIEMLTGEHAWKDLEEHNENPFSIMWKIGNCGRGPKIPEKISSDAKRFLGKCFDLEPKKRATAEMLLQEPFVTTAYVSSSLAQDDDNYSYVTEDDEYNHSPVNANYSSADINNYETYCSDEDDETEDFTDNSPIREVTSEYEDDEDDDDDDDDDDDEDDDEEYDEYDDDMISDVKLGKGNQDALSTLNDQLKKIDLNTSLATSTSSMPLARSLRSGHGIDSPRIVNLKPSAKGSFQNFEAGSEKYPAFTLSRNPIVSTSTISTMPASNGSASYKNNTTTTAPTSITPASSSTSIHVPTTLPSASINAPMQNTLPESSNTFNGSQEAIQNFIRQTNVQRQGSLNSLHVRQMKEKSRKKKHAAF